MAEKVVGAFSLVACITSVLQCQTILESFVVFSMLLLPMCISLVFLTPILPEKFTRLLKWCAYDQMQYIFKIYYYYYLKTGSCYETQPGWPATGSQSPASASPVLAVGRLDNFLIAISLASDITEHCCENTV